MKARFKRALVRNEGAILVFGLVCGAVSVTAALVSAAWTVFGW